MFVRFVVLQLLAVIMYVQCFNRRKWTGRLIRRATASFTTPLSSSVSSNIDLYRKTVEDILKDAEERVTKKDITRNIFCNVELNCANLEAVGFDMDFTLAQYNKDFDLLAFEGAKRKLVDILRYPKEVLDFEYNSDLVRRGLIIDKRRGNILKIDRHKYVRRAYHGMQELADRRVYNQQAAMFSGNNFAYIDTMFSVIDAILFMYMVDFRDRFPDQISKSYEQMYSDIRQSVDLCHRDGVIKDAVMRQPERYIIQDPDLVPMLQQFKAGGKKVFLLTNSLWEYTDVVMNYLVYNSTSSPQDSNNNKNDNNMQQTARRSPDSWQDLFDVIIVGGNKPAFLQQDYLSLFNVDTQTGNIRNIEDRESVYPPSISTVSAINTEATKSEETKSKMSMSKVFQGGCWQDLHRMLHVSYGDRILYVGDHMYSDILRSKRTLGWRTCLIIPELEHELHMAQKEAYLQSDIMQLRHLQYELDEYIDQLRSRIHDLQLSDTSAISNKKDNTSGKNELRGRPNKISALSSSAVSSTITNSVNAVIGAGGKDLGVVLGELEGDLRIALSKSDETKARLKKITEEYNRRFNPHWGQLLKAGHQHSRFAKQALDYACLYTSRASNLRFSSPNRAFRPIQDVHPADSFLYDFNYANLQSSLK